MVYRPDNVLKRLERLRQYRVDLAQWQGLELEEYFTQRNTRYAVERLLYLIAEAVLDILDHLLSARHEIVSDTYEGVLSNAHRNGLLTPDRYRELRGLGRFRNVLAHDYLGLDDATVHRQMEKMNRVFPDLLRDLARLSLPPDDASD